MLDQIKHIFTAPEIVSKTWHAIHTQDSAINLIDVQSMLSDIHPLWNTLFPKEQERLMRLILEKVIIHENELDIHIRADGMRSLLSTVKS